VLVLCCAIHTVLTLFCCAAPVLCYAHCSCAAHSTGAALTSWGVCQEKTGVGASIQPQTCGRPLCSSTALLSKGTNGWWHTFSCLFFNACTTSWPKMCTTAHICQHVSSLFLCIQNIAAGHISAHVRISQDTSGYVCICHHTSAFVIIRQHTLYVRKRHPSLTQPAPVCASNC
jgi:hypothetical protein